MDHESQLVLDVLPCVVEVLVHQPSRQTFPAKHGERPDAVRVVGHATLHVYRSGSVADPVVGKGEVVNACLFSDSNVLCDAFLTQDSNVVFNEEQPFSISLFEHPL